MVPRRRLHVTDPGSRRAAIAAGRAARGAAVTDTASAAARPLAVARAGLTASTAANGGTRAGGARGTRPEEGRADEGRAQHGQGQRDLHGNQLLEKVGKGVERTKRGSAWADSVPPHPEEDPHRSPRGVDQAVDGRRVNDPAIEVITEPCRRHGPGFHVEGDCLRRHERHLVPWLQLAAAGGRGSRGMVAAGSLRDARRTTRP